MSYRVVTDYHIIEASRPAPIICAMEKAIAENWEPIGGVVVTVDAAGNRVYTQTLIRREFVDEVHPKQNISAPEDEMRPECRVCQTWNTCPIT